MTGKLDTSIIQALKKFMFQMCELGSWDVVCLGSRDLGLGAVITELRLKFPGRQVGRNQGTAVSTGGLCARDLGDLRVGFQCSEGSLWWRGTFYQALRICVPGWKCLSDNQWGQCQAVSNLVLLSGRKSG